jgi:hypothetical protein
MVCDDDGGVEPDSFVGDSFRKVDSEEGVV